MESNRFYERFLGFLSRAPAHSFVSLLGLSKMAEISHAMDRCPLQDSFRFRTRYLGWIAARYLVREDGEIDLGRALALKKEIDKAPYLLGPRMEGDSELYLHLARCLEILLTNKEVGIALRKFSPPLCHKRAEEIVKETVWPDEAKKVETVHVKRAALGSWLTKLRQTTGSCFATAPAILIQEGQPERFFKDLYDLLSMGQLRRTIGGKGYTVPLSPTPGMGDLWKPLANRSELISLSIAPGLRVALEAVELIPTKIPIGEREALLREALSKIEERPETPEKLLRALVLQALSLSEEELKDEEHLSDIQMTPLLAKQSAVYYQRPSERGTKAAEFKGKFSKACAIFRAITECSLLRSWEYSIASFCDVKVDFGRWNLYVGLGLHPEQKKGIGDFLYQMINGKLQACNAEAAQHQADYERSIMAVRANEALLHRAGESNRHHVQAELSGAMHAANTALEMRDKAAAMAEALANGFSSLINQYDERLQEHFQEIFDPSIAGKENVLLYDDNPAGFRLAYKHGRADASLWSLIYTEDAFLNAIREFFSAVERDLRMPDPLGADFIAEVTTGIHRYLQEPEFLASAIERSRKQGRESPWNYVSGGTMQMLVQNYYSLVRPLTETVCTPRSADELMKFIRKASEEKKEPLLIHSPSHAFILRPDWMKGAWESQGLNLPFIKKWKLDEEMQEFIAHRLSDRLAALEKPLFLHIVRQKFAAESPEEFRNHLIACLKSIPNLQMKDPIESVDSILYEYFPLFRNEEAKAAIEKIAMQLLGDKKITVEIESNYVGANQIQRLVKEAVLAANQWPFSKIDWDLEVAKRARAANLCYPSPLIFADSNWSGWVFGWMINPATREWEMWRLNRTATIGVPLVDWKRYYSKENEQSWIVLPQRKEYGE